MAAHVPPQPPQPGQQPGQPAPQPQGPPQGPVPPPAPAPQPGQQGYDPNTVPTQDLRNQVPGMQAPYAQPPQPAPPPPGIPRPVQQADGSFVIETPTRQRYVGRTQQDVYDQVVSAQVNATQRLSQLTESERRARAAAQAALGGGTQLDDRGRVQAPRPQFQPDIYRQLEESDPLTAEWYKLQHMFGFESIEDTQERIPALFATYDEIVQDRTITGFYRNAPDFPATPQAVDTLLAAWEQTGSEFTPENLMHVHRSLMYAHQFDPRVGYAPAVPGQPQQAQSQQQQQPGQYAPAPAPDPRDAMMNLLLPQGNYNFSPDGGFGSRVPPPQAYNPAAAPPAAPAAPMYAAPPASGYPRMPDPNAPPAAYGYPPATYPAAAPQYAPAPSQYAAAPPPAYYPAPVGAPAAVPVPAMNAPGYNVPNTGMMDEATLYGMDRNQLRERIEQMAGIGR